MSFTVRRAYLVAGALIALAIGLLGSLGWPTAWPASMWTPLWRSTLQAGLSATVACALGLLMAFAAHHAASRWQPLWWRALLNTVPIMPTLVVVLMLLAAYGRSGALAQLGFTGGTWMYGLDGVVIAHAFINAPWVAQQLQSQFQGITLERQRLADQLGLSAWRRFKLVFWPLAAETLRRQWGLVFLLCFTSFAVVLVLSGSPRWATLEVRLYQLITLEFDIAGAVSLAWLQMLSLLALMVFLNRQGAAVVSLGRPQARQVRAWGSVVWLALSALWAIPMLALIVRALRLDWWALVSQPVVWQAAWSSLWIAAISASLALVLSWWLARGGVTRLGGLSGVLYFLIPSQVMALALFLAFRELGWGHPAAAVGLSNTLMCLPFMLTVLIPALARYPQDRLMASLGLSGSVRWRRVHWPRHRALLCWCWVFAFGLSLGDFGVVALFGSQDFVTLPYLLYQKLGSYRTGDAYGLALMMWAVLALLFVMASPRSPNVTGQ